MVLARFLPRNERFFDYFLKGIDNGWNRQPRVRLQVRHIDKFVERMENEWPIQRTHWTKFYLNAVDRSLSWSPVGAEGKIEFAAIGVPFADRGPQPLG